MWAPLPGWRDDEPPVAPGRAAAGEAEGVDALDELGGANRAGRGGAAFGSAPERTDAAGADAVAAEAWRTWRGSLSPAATAPLPG